MYMHDCFIFEFSLIKKFSIAIYVYDSNYDLYTDFHNATLKVYEDGRWIRNGVWEEKIVDYMRKTSKEIERLTLIHTQTNDMNEYRKFRKESQRVARFVRLFGFEVKEGINLKHRIPVDGGVEGGFEFTSEDTIDELMYVIFGAKTTNITK